MKGLKILVVDDRTDDIEHAASILRKKGHSVIPASDGNEGIRLAESEQPDLILMDLVMPLMNGFQAMRELGRNEATRDIPVIVLSCKDEEVDRIWAEKQGARAYLTKGYDESSLIATINKVFAGIKNQSEVARQ